MTVTVEFMHTSMMTPPVVATAQKQTDGTWLIIDSEFKGNVIPESEVCEGSVIYWS